VEEIKRSNISPSVVLIFFIAWCLVGMKVQKNIIALFHVELAEIKMPEGLFRHLDILKEKFIICKLP
jgi:hypothetical protein